MVNLKLIGLVLACILAFACCDPGPIPNDTLKTYIKAKQQYASGDIASAMDFAGKAYSQRGDFLQAGLLKAKAQLFSGKAKEAETLFSELYAKEPRFHEAGIWRIRALLALGRLEEAASLVDSMLAFDQDDPRLSYLEALIRIQKKDISGAIDWLERASNFSEELAKDYFELARLRFQYAQDDAASASLAKAAAILPEASSLLPAIRQLISLIDKAKNKERNASEEVKGEKSK